jgi:hypothetical protein
VVFKLKNLEEYLKESIENNNIDHAIRTQIDSDGKVSFYIHPYGADGDTLDFKVEDNQLIPLR